MTAPLFIILPLLIKLTSPGPVFYRQVRTGFCGRPFTMWKFRSMVVDAEREGRALWSMERDPRVTRIGAVMREVRLDELPQLFNIVRGDMNFVGPRPERPEFVEMLERTIPAYHKRHLVKPGLTGWAQVRFRYAASVEDTKTKLAYDLEYINRRSFALDCWIIVQTVGVVLRGVQNCREIALLPWKHRTDKLSFLVDGETLTPTVFRHLVRHRIAGGRVDPATSAREALERSGSEQHSAELIPRLPAVLASKVR